MGARKEVFITATSADLGSYRQAGKEAVLKENIKIRVLVRPPN
jgi:hypothetical protein